MRISDWSSDVCSSDLRCCRPTTIFSTKCSLTRTNDNFTQEKQCFRNVKLQCPAVEAHKKAPPAQGNGRGCIQEAVGLSGISFQTVVRRTAEPDSVIAASPCIIAPLRRDRFPHSMIRRPAAPGSIPGRRTDDRSEEHTSELQSLMRN